MYAVDWADEAGVAFDEVELCLGFGGGGETSLDWRMMRLTHGVCSAVIGVGMNCEYCRWANVCVGGKV